MSSDEEVWLRNKMGGSSFVREYLYEHAGMAKPDLIGIVATLCDDWPQFLGEFKSCLYVDVMLVGHDKRDFLLGTQFQTGKGSVKYTYVVCKPKTQSFYTMTARLNIYGSDPSLPIWQAWADVKLPFMQLPLEISAFTAATEGAVDLLQQLCASISVQMHLQERKPARRFQI